MISRFLKDEDFIRGKYSSGKIVPLTKREIRILTMDRLRIEPEDQILDIGAGTGGLSIEAARWAYNGQIISVEKSPEALELIRINSLKHGINNVQVLMGEAPQILEKLKDIRFDKVIIGGSNGNLEAILEWVYSHLTEKGRICANFITLENAYKALAFMKDYFQEVELIQCQISRGEITGDLTLMKAENPIFLLSGAVKRIA